MDPIRIGLVNCDLHGLYYAALMGGYDPVSLRDAPVCRGHAAYFYSHLHYSDPRTMTVPGVEGMRITRLWDSDPSVAADAARILNPKATVCASVEETSDNVDLVFIADCNGDGSDHLRLATPGLRKGVPTFVDKPFALEYDNARRMVKLAREAATPLMSASMLGFTPDVLHFRNRFPELGEPEFGTIKGGGAAMAGHIHAICFAQTLFGDGVVSVEAMGPTPLAYVHLDYGDKPGRPRQGVVLNCASGGSPHCAMYASAYGAGGAIHSPPIGDFVFPLGAGRILELTKQMVATRKPQIPYNTMLEWIAVATAARRAQAEHRPMALSEITT